MTITCEYGPECDRDSSHRLLVRFVDRHWQNPYYYCEKHVDRREREVKSNSGVELLGKTAIKIGSD